MLPTPLPVPGFTRCWKTVTSYYFHCCSGYCGSLCYDCYYQNCCSYHYSLLSMFLALLEALVRSQTQRWPLLTTRWPMWRLLDRLGASEAVIGALSIRAIAHLVNDRKCCIALLDHSVSGQIKLTTSLRNICKFLGLLKCKGGIIWERPFTIYQASIAANIKGCMVDRPCDLVFQYSCFHCRR